MGLLVFFGRLTETSLVGRKKEKKKGVEKVFSDWSLLRSRDDRHSTQIALRVVLDPGREPAVPLCRV